MNRPETVGRKGGISKTTLALLFLCIFAAGCVLPNIADLTAEQVRQQCTVSHDDFRKVTYVDALNLTWGDMGENQFWLSARRSDNSSAVGYYMEFKTYRPWAEHLAFWKSAVDHDGQELRVVSVHRDETSATGVNELVEVPLSREYLNAHSAAGTDIRMEGKRDTHVANLPANYIQGFLLKVDETFK